MSKQGTMKAVRLAAEKKSNLKAALETSLEPVMQLLSERFSPLVYKEELIKTHSPASEDELDLFHLMLDVICEGFNSFGAKKNLPKEIVAFMEQHCQERHYTYQVGIISNLGEAEKLKSHLNVVLS